jgi:TatD DNase family protein
MMLVDSHCHLDFPELAERLDEVLARAKRAGVVQMVTISTRVRRFDQIRAIAEKYDNVFCSIGTHPHYAAEEADVTSDELVAIAAHPKVVGIGETGLDYYYDKSPRDLQQTAFRRHIEAARRSGLPLIVHTRDAEEDTAAILREELAAGRFEALMHCFTSSRRLADQALAMGFYISLSGVVTFKKSEELQETVRHLPLDRLLVETDAPYLAPVPHRGKTNEPAYALHTAERLAELQQRSLAEVARATTQNFQRVFAKVPAPAEAAAGVAKA